MATIAQPRALDWHVTPDDFLTYEDYCALPDDGRRHEILGGIHHESPAPFSLHQLIVTRLFRLLLPLLDVETGGELITAPFDVVLGEHDVVQPDLVWISAERLDRLCRKNLQGAPDLVVEILSPSTHRIDEKIKKLLYESHDVREYWIVDPDLETVRLFEREPGGVDSQGFGRFAPPRELDAEHGDRLSSALFPALDADVADLFD